MLSYHFRPSLTVPLIRLGSTNDGGYLTTKKAVLSADGLISLGVRSNWDFEKDFYSINQVSIHAFDSTSPISFIYYQYIKIIGKILLGKFAKISNLRDLITHSADYFFFFRRRVHFEKKTIGNTSQGHTNLDEIFDLFHQNAKLFLSVDIESAEYDILATLINRADNLTGLVIEFHGCDQYRKDIEQFIEHFNLTLVHIHANNYGGVDENGDPRLLELSFVHPNTLAQEMIYEPPSLPHSFDRPCNAKMDELSLRFAPESR
ncbi:MAG: hypothetical protein AAF442_04180 [Pseudomonadota bacterium]